MEKNKLAYLIRGEKWFNIRKVCIVLEKVKKVEWMNLQESIVNDIKAYEEFMVKLKAAGFNDLGELDLYEEKIIMEDKKKAGDSEKEKSEEEKSDEKEEE